MNPTFENDLLENWSQDMQLQMGPYKEPLLGEFTINVIKILCDTFKQDLQVFFMTVDVLEQYIIVKNFKKEKVCDPLLSLGASVFITSKYYGGGADLKVPIIEKFLNKLTGNEYSIRAVMTKEQEILRVLDHRLPMTTILDDFDTFFEKYMREYRLKIALRPLCIEILQLLYMKRNKWFTELKDFYKDEIKTFEYLVSSKFYLPAGTLISAFKSTNYEFILDIDGLLQDLKIITKMHPDHIYALSAVILELMKN